MDVSLFLFHYSIDYCFSKNDGDTDLLSSHLAGMEPLDFLHEPHFVYSQENQFSTSRTHFASHDPLSYKAQVENHYPKHCCC